jgi:hypothetical protein
VRGVKVECGCVCDDKWAEALVSDTQGREREQGRECRHKRERKRRRGRRRELGHVHERGHGRR